MRRSQVREESRAGNHANEDQEIALEMFARQEGCETDEAGNDEAHQQPAECAQDDADHDRNDLGAHFGGAVIRRCDHQSA